MRCDLHCPGEGGGMLAAVAAGAGLLLAYLAAEVIESMLLAMFITAVALLTVASCVAVRVLRSHRGTSYAMYEPPKLVTVQSVVVRPQPREVSAPRRAIPPARTVLQATPEPVTLKAGR